MLEVSFVFFTIKIIATVSNIVNNIFYKSKYSCDIFNFSAYFCKSVQKYCQNIAYKHFANLSLHFLLILQNNRV
jgi:hypothetical protein